MGSTERVVVIGGGLAGLTCALTVRGRVGKRAEVVIIEAEEVVGGRVGSERVAGFTLDLGFQVYLETYENAGRLLDLKQLDLRGFTKGAVVHRGGEFCRVVDPLAEFRQVFGMLGVFGREGVLSTGDLVALGRVAVGGGREVFRAGVCAEEALRAVGFGERMIERFWRPFFGGVFFDRELQTDAAMLGFVLDHFRRGRACVPARGMGMISEQLGSRCLGSGVDVRTGMRVERVDAGGVTLWNGDRVDAGCVVVATEGDVAGELVGGVAGVDSERVERMKARGWRSTRTFWFAVPAAFAGAVSSGGKRGILHLDGTGGVVDDGWAGPVNHLAVMTDVSAAYGAGDGRALVCANVVGVDGDTDSVERAAREQLARWFDSSSAGGVDEWELLKVHEIRKALPGQFVEEGGMGAGRDGYAIADGVFVAGDHVTNASIDGAIASGVGCGEAVCEWLRGR